MARNSATNRSLIEQPLINQARSILPQGRPNLEPHDQPPPALSSAGQSAGRRSGRRFLGLGAGPRLYLHPCWSRASNPRMIRSATTATNRRGQGKNRPEVTTRQTATRQFGLPGLLPFLGSAKWWSPREVRFVVVQCRAGVPLAHRRDAVVQNFLRGPHLSGLLPEAPPPSHVVDHPQLGLMVSRPVWDVRQLFANLPVHCLTSHNHALPAGAGTPP